MKKSLFLAVVLLLSSFVGISAKDWAFFSRYADENAVVEKLPESQRRVVMMGNSITKMWAETDTAFFVDNGHKCCCVSVRMLLSCIRKSL